LQKTGAKLERPPVYRITVVQCVVLFFAWCGLQFENQVLAYSAVLGGLTAILPQAYFAARVFRHRGAKSAKQIAQSSYAGEVGKFVLTVAGFAAIFAGVRPIEAWIIFAAYGLMLVIQVTGSWLLLR
jgi:ATP synthase protein I